MSDLYQNIDKSALPSHVAVIMDGNGRWAQNQGQDRLFGHQYGVKSVKKIVEAAAELGIKYLTLYAFSTENWNRPKSEIEGLMSLLVSTLRAEVKTLNENDTQLQVIGDMSSLPDSCTRELQEAIDLTASNSRLILTLALSYSARWEIARAAREIARRHQSGLVELDDITEDYFASQLTTADIPDPELLIRSSGEVRISNFLLFQLAYAELYFCDTLWPDFGKEDFAAAIEEYQRRERRFGMTSEQINSK